MCGIAGFVAQPGRGRSAYAASALQAIKHRGPDDYGWLRLTGGQVERGREWNQPGKDPEVLLLHRRLSIIDTTQSGWQPMSTANGRHHIVYNGEIYNYLELRKELEGLGHRFRSASDTEVLLNAYAQWGTDALRRFVGMFAFALLDTKRRTVMLARDYFGIKPLYYRSEGGCICFGSEIKALPDFARSRPQANTERLLLYLRYGMTDFGSETMLSQIQQIPAAHFMEICLDGCRAEAPQRYWSVGSDRALEIPFEEAALKVRDLFLRSVELHLRSDVPLGSALSGGIDSSSIVMAIRHLDPNADIHAFSFISEDRALSEEKWVDIVAHNAQAHVHKVGATKTELQADLDSMMESYDEPFGSTSVYAQFLVFRAARDAGVKVMLDGQGADEILGGYDHYKGARLASLLRQGHWMQAAHFLQKLSQGGGIGKHRGMAYCADFLLPPALQSLARSLVGKDAFPVWLNRAWFEEREVGAAFVSYIGAKNVLRCSLRRSVSETLPGLLRYEDRNSMASSVESRVPFLTPDLVNFLGMLPESYLIDSDGTSKAVFRKAMRGIVPDAVLDRRDKIGFATPEKWWLNLLDGWVQSALDSEAARSMPFLNLKFARRELEAIRRDSRPFGFHVWRWVNLIRWTEKMGVTY